MHGPRVRLARRAATTAAVVGAVLVLGTATPALASGDGDGAGPGGVLGDLAGRSAGSSVSGDDPVGGLVRGVRDAAGDMGTVRDGVGAADGGAAPPSDASDLTGTLTGGGARTDGDGSSTGRGDGAAPGSDAGHGDGPGGGTPDPLAALPDLPRLCETLRDAASSLPPDLRADPAALFRAVPRGLTEPLPPSLRDTVLAECRVETGPAAPEPDTTTPPDTPAEDGHDATAPSAAPASAGEAAALPHTGAPGLWLPALGGLLTLVGARLARVRRG